MTQAIAKYAAKKMLSSEMNKYKDKKVESEYDPYYQKIPHPRYPDDPKKFKKVKKQIPYYIPAHDAEILARARKTAYRLDFCLFNFLGFRFGWSSVIGLVPVVGDGADGLLALNLILRMRKIQNGLPHKILVMMVINLLVDFLVGLIPFVGDLADAAIKCNSKNVRLLEKHLDKLYKPESVKVEQKRMNRESRPGPATVFEDFSEEEDDRQNTFEDRYDNVRRPNRAYSGRQQRIRDEEMGIPRHDTRPSEKPVRNTTKSSRRH